MNTFLNSANVDFGNPNEEPRNPEGQPVNFPDPSKLLTNSSIQNTFSQNTNNTNNTNNNSKNQLSFKQKILNFLNSKSGTIIASAMGLAIGFSFKDVIGSFVLNIIQPLIVSVIMITRLNEIYDFDAFIQSNSSLQLTKFISTLITFILIVITVYYVNAYII